MLIPKGVDPEDLDSLVLRPQKRGVTFVCPVCRKRYRTDIAGLEPMCTGPHESLDEHEMTVMERE